MLWGANQNMFCTDSDALALIRFPYRYQNDLEGLKDKTITVIQVRKNFMC